MRRNMPQKDFSTHTAAFFQLLYFDNLLIKKIDAIAITLSTCLNTLKRYLRETSLDHPFKHLIWAHITLNTNKISFGGEIYNYFSITLI